ncbi:MAG TPA: 3-oxoacyl-ACP reductase [Firmicutes bacterium]|jgi:3-oxoacyl-[acyl-carrier protein] reductase|nr:3-oxoacyl-ACP reductase [Bacillota bacterium]
MTNRKTVLITGASRGIGKATAELFGMKDYNVLINYNHSESAARELFSSLQKKGASVALFRADVSQRAAVDSMIKFCTDTFGGIDILINNAGIAASKLFIDITESEWDQMMNINLKSVFNCSQAVLHYMISQKRGKIINIASIWGLVGASCEVHYSAAKAGVIGLTKALAKELGPSHIQVNCIAPGVIQTDMLESFQEEDRAELRSATPLQRLGKPEDIAAAAFFLASDAADFITGQVLSPNGGFVI